MANPALAHRGITEQGLWDDLCVIPPFAINPTGPAGSMTVITDAAGYLGCLQADAVNEGMVVNFQVPHRYLLGTDLKPHIHVVRNDGADNIGNVEFDAVFRVIPLNGTAGAWTVAANGATTEQPVDGADKSGTISWTLANATYNFNISDVIVCYVRRSGITTGSVAITSADLHGQIGQIGSRLEGSL
jgi:hypothetical protein